MHREATLKSFKKSCFKKVAHVVMGEPSPDFKSKQHALLLKHKKAKAEAQWKAAKAE